MHIVTSSGRLRSGTARRFVLRAAPGIVLLTSLTAACNDIDRDPPRYADGSVRAPPRSDAGDASLSGGDASASDAASDASSSGMDGGDTGTQDGGADDSSADDASADAADAAADATVLPACTTPAPGPEGCFACTLQGWLGGLRE